MSSRWWLYQKERFPVFKNGLLILAFSVSAVGYSALLRGQEKLSYQLLGAGAIAFITLFLFFAQLRVADEFKDFEADARYRPYRPVPRGLVTLKELGIVAIAAGCVQLGLAFALGMPLVLLLGAVWGYMLLMFREFFAPEWLKARPLLYLLSHAVIMPLMALYASACDWVVVGVLPAQGLLWFLLVSFFNSMMIEVGRKIRAPQNEEAGVETYTALWGRPMAVTVWLLVTWLTAIATLMAGNTLQFIAPVAVVLVLLLSLSMFVAWQFLSKPTSKRAKQFEIMTGLGTLLVYLVLGIAPWVIQYMPNISIPGISTL